MQSIIFDSYNLKMSIVEQPSNSSINDQTSKSHIASNKIHNRFEEIVHDPDNLNPIQENQNEGAETPTPAKPPVYTGQAQGNPEARDSTKQQAKMIQEGFQLTKKMIVIGVLIILAVIAATITVVALYMARSRFQIVVETSFMATKLGTTDGVYETQRVKATDPETFNTNTPLTIYTSQARSNTGPEKQANGKRLLEQTKEQIYSVYSFRDERTDATMVVSSKDMQIKASFSLNSVLQFVLNNQDFPQDVPDSRNLQATGSPSTPSTPSAPSTPTVSPSTAISPQTPTPIATPSPDAYKEYTFYAVNYKAVNILQEDLLTQDKGVKVTQQASIDIQFNEQKSLFQFAPPVSPPSESVAFFDPKDTPKILDFNNQAEVANAMKTVMRGVLDKAKKFLSRHLADIERVTQVKLVQNDQSDGETSLYVDQPQDFCKLCANVNDKTVRCDVKAASSKSIDIDTSNGGQQVDSNPTIVVTIDM